jgi:hypothetical protein
MSPIIILLIPETSSPQAIKFDLTTSVRPNNKQIHVTKTLQVDRVRLDNANFELGIAVDSLATIMKK